VTDRPSSPRPASSVLLVRAGEGASLEVYMIRRHTTMRFLGGYYAFPGGSLDSEDATPAMFERCRGLGIDEAERSVPSTAAIPALTFWVSAARELLEETGVLLARDENDLAIDRQDPTVAGRLEAMRQALISAGAPLHVLLADAGWYLDLAPFRYLSHFITPPSSPIRFTARFFLAPVPAGQEARHFDEEHSEGFWIDPQEGYRRFGRGEMPMAEPAYSGLAYLACFESLDQLWAAHADGRHKIHGINDRLDARGLRLPRRGVSAGPGA
jgi:8-oxo-dGTP pyrophosphatase MutT (NUDIX family)